MPIEILMPALSPTMEEGNLAKWVKKEGDSVAAGDVIAEIETDKATMEVEAVDEGVLGRILVAEGTEGVKVNTPIALLLAEARMNPRSMKPLPAVAGPMHRNRLADPASRPVMAARKVATLSPTWRHAACRARARFIPSRRSRTPAPTRTFRMARRW